MNEAILAAIVTAIGAVLLRLIEWYLNRDDTKINHYVKLGDLAYERIEDYANHLEDELAALRERLDFSEARHSEEQDRYVDLMDEYQKQQLQMSILWLTLQKIAAKYGEPIPDFTAIFPQALPKIDT